MTATLKSVTLTGSGTHQFGSNVQGEITVDNTGLSAATFTSGGGEIPSMSSKTFKPPGTETLSGTQRDGGAWVRLGDIPYSGNLTIWYWELS